MEKNSAHMTRRHAWSVALASLTAGAVGAVTMGSEPANAASAKTLDRQIKHLITMKGSRAKHAITSLVEGAVAQKMSLFENKLDGRYARGADVIVCSQVEYNALNPSDNKLYVIVG